MNNKKLKIVLNSPVVITFAILSLIALILGFVTRGASTDLLFSTYRAPLTSPLTWIRFFTHVLGHSGWTHYLANMSYILLLGPILEEKYGSVKILGVISITAVVTALIHFIFFPKVALLGASGVVFAFILLTSFTGFRDGEIPLTFILVAVIFLGQQFFDGIFQKDNISQLSHIIGGVIGAGAGYMLNRKN